MIVRLGEEGMLNISTVSCGILVSQTDFFSVSATQLIVDFNICNNPIGNDCEAFFDYSPGEFPLSIQFYDLSLGWPTSWHWDFGDGTSSSEQNPLHLYLDQGSYLTSLTIAGDSCNSVFELLIQVDNDTTTDCEASFEYLPGIIPLSMQFLDNSLGEIDTWSWDFGDGNISSEQHPIHTFETEGMYYVSLNIETADFCFSHYGDSIFVNVDTVYCNANFDVTLDTINNIPNTYIFIDQSEGATQSWYWDFGDGDFSFEQNPIHVYSEGGTYYPCLTITSEPGIGMCSSTECKEVNTIEYYNFGGQAFIGNYPINIDSGDNANIAIAYLYRKINHAWYYMDQREFWEYGYYWFVDKPIGEYLITTKLTENSIDYNQYAPSYYPNATSWKKASTFTLSNNQQFAVNISLYKLASSVSGIGSISGLIIGGPSCDTNYNINIHNVLIQLFNSSKELISYTYSDSEGNYEFTGLGMGNYYIVPEYTGKYTEEINITLSDIEPSLNNIDLIINCSHPLDIEEISSKFIGLVEDIYPNPVIENANIDITINNSSNIKIDILNQFGQILYSNKIYLSTGEHTINFPTSSFVQGMYFVKITTEDYIYSTHKFIKTK